MHRKIVEPMIVMYVTQELTIPEVGAYGEKYGSEIMAEVERHGLRVAGPWVFISYNLPRNGKDRYVVDYCLPILNSDEYSGNMFSIRLLSSFSCAYLEYRGKLKQLFTKGYQPLVQEIVAAGAKFTGESREVYHSWAGPNSVENRIELQFGVE